MSSGLVTFAQVPPVGSPPDWVPALKLVVVKPWMNASQPLNPGGDVYGLDRDNAGVWRRTLHYTIDGGTFDPNPRLEYVYRDPTWIRATNQRLYGVAARGETLRLFTDPPTGVFEVQTDMPFQCGGCPGFIQSSFGGEHGNFELIAPLVDGGMLHLWRDNSGGLAPDAQEPQRWHRARRFGSNRVHAVRLIQDAARNLHVIALEETGGARTLVHYYQRGAGGDWFLVQELPGSRDVVGIPGFIQSTFESVPGIGQGNFEVVAPAIRNRQPVLLSWYRDNALPHAWNGPFADAFADVPRLRAVHLIQNPIPRQAGAPVVHGAFTVIGEQPDAVGIGHSALYEFTKLPRPPWSWSHRRIEPRGAW